MNKTVKHYRLNHIFDAKCKTIFSLFFLFLFFGCNQPYHLVQTANVKDTFIIHSSPTFKGYYYMGSDKVFHYFASRWKLKRDVLFKLKKEDLQVHTEQVFKNYEVKVDLWDTGKPFGSNSYYRLYFVD